MLFFSFILGTIMFDSLKLFDLNNDELLNTLSFELVNFDTSKHDLFHPLSVFDKYVQLNDAFRLAQTILSCEY